MNYKKQYDLLIEKHGSKGKPSSYSERHHIVPRCLGGLDDESNLVYLSAEAHYVAHHLLFKIDRDNKLGRAFMLMSDRFRIKSRAYQIAKELASLNMLGDLNPAKRDEVKKKMSASQKANSFFAGKKRP